MRGTLHWAKVLGEPRMNDFAGQRQWSVDVTPDAKGLAEMKRLKKEGIFVDVKSSFAAALGGGTGYWSL